MHVVVMGNSATIIFTYPGSTGRFVLWTSDQKHRTHVGLGQTDLFQRRDPEIRSRAFRRGRHRANVEPDFSERWRTTLKKPPTQRLLSRLMMVS